eukprot:5613312-Pleurochrysis_carterae.AAC.4
MPPRPFPLSSFTSSTLPIPLPARVRAAGTTRASGTRCSAPPSSTRAQASSYASLTQRAPVSQHTRRPSTCCRS